MGVRRSVVDEDTENGGRDTISIEGKQVVVADYKHESPVFRGVGRRREQLAGLHVQQHPGNQEFLAEGVPEGWERFVIDVSNIYDNYRHRWSTSYPFTNTCLITSDL